jgi:hypothetical protein
VNRILISDATATIAGALSATSTVVSYIESAAAWSPADVQASRRLSPVYCSSRRFLSPRWSA